MRLSDRAAACGLESARGFGGRGFLLAGLDGLRCVGVGPLRELCGVRLR